MLHTVKNDEGIRQFFQEAYENYIKVSSLPSKIGPFSLKRL
jgi:hypothetical protein